MYRRIPYGICPLGGRDAPIRIGRRSRQVDALLLACGVRRAGLVTAWNPLGRRQPAGRNRRLQAGLLAAARRLPGRPGWSGTGIWFEEQRLLLADPRRLAVLGRRFRQNAVVLLRRGGEARLLWLRREVSGGGTA